MAAPVIHVDLSGRHISFVRGAPTIQLVREAPTFILAGGGSGGGGAGGLPVRHPTLANTKLLAVPEGFQFMVEGEIIMTLTKGGITYGA